jgi:hypothetical protein
MKRTNRSRRIRSFRPVIASLEDRNLLSTVMPHHAPGLGGPAAVHVDAHHRHHAVHQTALASITILNQVKSGRYTFTNFDGPQAGTNSGSGTNMNGISNNGVPVGFTVDNDGALHNFVTDISKRSALLLNINGSTTAMAIGVNAHGTVVGTDGNGNAFTLSHGVLTTFIPPGGTSAAAFGINDEGTIVGQYATGGATPGFVREKDGSFITINAPSGPNIVFAQGISNKGLVVGFYVGTDGQDHGFTADVHNAHQGGLNAVAISDPTIPVVPGEPGATFVFSQVLAVNKNGIAVGYYGDSTNSQHGFLYDTRSGHYRFLDDPSEAFSNGVEVTQITGITDSGELTGFYSDANGVFHGFVATAPKS